jgi:hypothetical protein
MTARPPIELLLGDVVRLERTHPCGGDEWLVDRLGADIGLRCRRCDRHVLIARRTLEQRLAGFVSRGDPGDQRRGRADRRGRRAGPQRVPTLRDRDPRGDGDIAGPAASGGALAVFKIRPFLFLWLAQAFTQIGGNMVIFGLTIIIAGSTNSTAAVSALILTVPRPGVLFSAVAGVFVDRLDKRLVLIATNILRGAAFLGVWFRRRQPRVDLRPQHLHLDRDRVLQPAEASMIPIIVPKKLLLSANGIFTLTLNAAFALGFALLGPLVVKIAGAEVLVFIVAITYFVAAVLCVTLPGRPPHKEPVPEGGHAMTESEAVKSVFIQLREGLVYIRATRKSGGR